MITHWVGGLVVGFPSRFPGVNSLLESRVTDCLKVGRFLAASGSVDMQLRV